MSDGAIRIDIWLWRARFMKTRRLAIEYAGKGRIRIGSGASPRRVEKASTLVRPGDTLTFPLRNRIVCLKVIKAGDRRGPAAEARSLYELIVEEDAPDV